MTNKARRPMLKHQTAAIVALTIGAVGALLLLPFVPIGEWWHVLIERLYDELRVYIRVIFAVIAAYYIARDFAGFTLRKKPNSRPLWLYVLWVLISGGASFVWGLIYNIDKEGATDMDRSLTALTAFVVLVFPGLLGTHTVLEDKEKSSADAGEEAEDGAQPPAVCD
jgi:hypothetical protein